MNNLRIIITAYLVVLGVCSSVAQNQSNALLKSDDPQMIMMRSIQKLIQNNDLESAENAIAAALEDSVNTIIPSTECYLTLYEAEILYKQSLLNLCLVTSSKAGTLAQNQNNDWVYIKTLVLSSKCYLQTNQIEDARSTINQAEVELLDSNVRDYRTLKDEIRVTKAEYYLLKEQPDSALFLADYLLLQRTSSFKIIAQATWIKAEAFARLDKTDAAESLVQSFINERNETGFSDWHLLMAITKLKLLVLKNATDSSGYYNTQNKKFLESNLISRQTKLAYLEFYTDIQITSGQPENALKALLVLKKFRDKYYDADEVSRARHIKLFYIGRDEYAQERMLRTLQEKEISLRKRLTGTLIGLLCLAILASVISWKYFVQRQKNQRLAHEYVMAEQVRTSKLEAINQSLKALHLERNRISADLHDDIGAGLSGINIYSNLALTDPVEKSKELEVMLIRIQEDSSNLLERMSDIIWSINPEHERLRDILLRIKNNAINVLSPMGIEIKYNVEGDLENLKLSLQARKNIYLAIKEALNNIAKYSDASEVEISVYENGDELAIQIKDNGIGFDSEAIQKGNGMDNMLARMHSVGGTFTYKSALGKGTQLHFILNITTISD